MNKEIQDFLTKYKGKTFSRTEDVFEWLEKQISKLCDNSYKEGRDFLKKELLLEIENMENKGYEESNIISIIKNLLRF